MPILLDLFITFFLIGLFSFGGGYGMISLLRSIVIDKNWLTAAEVSDMIAVSEATPGPLSVNMAESRVTNAHHIINSALTGSRSPAGPQRLRDSDTHKRIAVPKAFCVLWEHPRPRPKSGKVCRSDTRPRRVSEPRKTVRG